MRILSFIIAFAIVFIGPPLAGTPDGSLPGIGAFSYPTAPIVMASR